MTYMMTLQQALDWVPGATLWGDRSIEVTRVHTDTRTVESGDFFVALRGEHYDANEFLAEAKAKGAAAVISDSREKLEKAQVAGLVVQDTRKALGLIARGWRSQFKLPLIAVTGSNGKTTVTQMIASILRVYRPQTMLATEGNFNNDVGVPLTLLRLNASHQVAVVELGMNHPGEIAALAALAAPTVALVNNAQREHQEFMTGVEAVARENGAVIEALGPSGVAVFPADDAYAALWRTLARGRPVLTFSTQTKADVTARATWSGDAWQVTLRTPAGTTGLRLAVAGLHNVQNAAAAAACALAAGCPFSAVARGLQQFVPVQGRSQVLTWQRDAVNVILIDDSYNANPDSVRAAIDVLAGLPGPHWLVLGDMGEVGSQGVAYHSEVGAYAVQRGIEALWTVGELSRHTADAFPGARHFAQVDEVLAALADAPQCASTLVKGSRFMKTERVVAAMRGSEGQSNAH